MTEFKRHMTKIKKDAAGCWIWTGGKDPDGYGICRINKRSARAHRASYEHFNGPIPNGEHILHTCDNPSCVNPKHLFTGSCADNMADKVAKKRQARLEKHGRSKLTKDAVLFIRASSEIDENLAKQFGVSKATINFARRSITWQSL